MGESAIQAINRTINALRREPGCAGVVKLCRPGVWRRISREGFYRAEKINGDYVSKTWLALIAVGADEIRLYPDLDTAPCDVIRTADVRWYGRPVKYQDYPRNEIWLHVERKDGWFTYKLWLWRDAMADLVRALKQVTPEPLVRAYRRRRPYVHFGPVNVHPATQDIYGAWTLDAPRTLYLTPLHLVTLNGERVTGIVPLETVQHIRAGARLDAPEANGLVQFTAGSEKIAFTLPHYTALAESLAEAAKRSLEDPIARKQKSKDDDDED